MLDLLVLQSRCAVGQKTKCRLEVGKKSLCANSSKKVFCQKGKSSKETENASIDDLLTEMARWYTTLLGHKESLNYLTTYLTTLGVRLVVAVFFLFSLIENCYQDCALQDGHVLSW
jgi:hypothetical protein